MYPLLLKPAVKDYLWGGTRLKTEYKYETDKEIAAEAWVLSCHKDGADRVENGSLAGKTLSEVIEHWGDKAIGEKAVKFPYFPLLIKLIDAKDRLSVQVHPDDEYALKNEGEFGKTEMWYVVDCDEGAQLIYGFNKELTRDEFKKSIEDNTFLDYVNKVNVKKGDVFFIEAGTLHAIGGGILLAEVQQNCNLIVFMTTADLLTANPVNYMLKKHLMLPIQFHQPVQATLTVIKLLLMVQFHRTFAPANSLKCQLLMLTVLIHSMLTMKALFLFLLQRARVLLNVVVQLLKSHQVTVFSFLQMQVKLF